MSLSFVIPETRTPSEVISLIGATRPKPKYLIATKKGKFVPLEKASVQDVKQEIETLGGKDVGIADEFLNLHFVRLAIVSNLVDRAIQRSTKLLGGAEVWEAMAPWKKPSDLPKKEKK